MLQLNVFRFRFGKIPVSGEKFPVRVFREFSSQRQGSKGIVAVHLGKIRPKSKSSLYFPCITGKSPPVRQHLCATLRLEGLCRKERSIPEPDGTTMPCPRLDGAGVIKQSHRPGFGHNGIDREDTFQRHSKSV